MKFKVGDKGIYISDFSNLGIWGLIYEITKIDEAKIYHYKYLADTLAGLEIVGRHNQFSISSTMEQGSYLLSSASLKMKHDFIAACWTKK